MTSKLKRVSCETEAKVLELATRNRRTFVAELDRVVEAGLTVLAADDPPQRNPSRDSRA